ncbi:autotransporter domain-containing protein [Azorhizobium oxalatiphilum]|uniref:autotransporter domain-containing protein n=1 Tax=Azorhizobium oxalatiphilum TaxID=980631 RepID=UPI00166E11F7|nr:autotransporter domain-containing protein [Azorhizobium oxalatiphilum]
MSQTTLTGSYTSTVELGSYLSGNPFIITSAAQIVVGGGGNGVHGASGTVWTITNEGSIQGANVAILLEGAGTITQSGTVNGVIGIEMAAGGSVLTTASSAIRSSDFGVEILGAAGTISNAGSILGKTGVHLGVADSSVNNTGVISGYAGFGGSGIVLDNGGTITNSGSLSRIFGDRNAILVSAGRGTVINEGMIWGTGTGSTVRAVALLGGGTINNANTGFISSPGTGVAIYGGTGTIYNQGTIQGSADGVYLAAGGTITNTADGGISGFTRGAVIAGGAGSVSNDGTITAIVGVELHQGGSVTNTGDIGGGVQISGGAGSLQNSGVISSAIGTGVYLAATGTVENLAAGEISGAQYGVRLSGAGTVTNTGHITSDSTAVQMNGGALSNTGSASSIVGAFYGVLSSASLSMVNSGTIAATSSTGFGVRLFQGGAVTNNATGVISGSVYGLVASGAAVTLNNSGTVTSGSGAGVYFVDSAGTFNNTVTNSGTISGGGGAAAVKFGAGNDLLQISQGAVFNGLVDGGGGTNTLEVLSGTVSLPTFSNFGVVQIDAAASASISGTHSLIALTNSGSLINTGTLTATTLSNAGLLTNSGSIGETVTLTASGAVVDNLAGGIISGGTAGVKSTLDGAGVTMTVNNAGTIAGSTITASGVALASAGTVNNSSAAALITGAIAGVYIGGLGTILNRGSIDGLVRFGAALGTGGSINNSGRISGYAAGVAVQGGVARITNTSTIAGTGTASIGVQFLGTATGIVDNATTASVISGTGTGISLDAGGTILNAGTITGMGFDGIALAAGGSVNNSGRISGAASGIYVGGGTATVTNTGLISATGASGVGVLFGGTGQGTIDNFGTISGAGGTAVKFAGGTNRLILENGSVLSGIADGTLGVNTLVVTGSAMLDSVTAIGFQYVGFIDATRVVDATSTITNPVVISGTLSNQGTLNGAVGVDLAATLINEGVVNADAPSANDGTIISSGSFTNNSALTNTGLFSNAGSVLNSGTIIGSGIFANSGIFTNNGWLVADGTGVSGSGTVTNNGVIIGTTDTGVDLGAGGTLINNAGGFIQGGEYGVRAGVGAVVVNAGTILDDDVAGMSLASNAVAANSGTIGGTVGVLFTGTGASLTNTGTITGTGGIAVQFGAGSNSLTLGTGSVLNGGIDGGTGAGQITLAGTGAISSTIANFGAGSALTIASGAVWQASGTWTIASVTNAGTLQAGTAAGGLSLTGDFTQSAGGTFLVLLDPSGLSSRLSVTGTATIEGGTLAVQKVAGTYVPGTRYTVLSATGGVSGTFSTMTQDLPFIELALSYDATDVYLTAGRNAASFPSVALTSNQRATAAAVEALGASNPVYAAVVSQSSAAGARRAFNALSGEIHATVNGVLTGDSRLVRGAVLDRMQDGWSSASGGAVTAIAGTGNVFWMQGFGNWGTTFGDGNASSVSRNTDGLMVGYDGTVADIWRVGFAAGYSHGTFSQDALVSSGSSDNYHVAIYGGADFGPLDAKIGAAFTWSDISTSRTIVFPGFAQQAHSDYSAQTSQVFGELGYRVMLPGMPGQAGGSVLEPFVGLAHVNVSSNSFQENGGSAALSGTGLDQGVTYSTLGLHASSNLSLFALPVTVKGTLGWVHAFGDLDPQSRVAFTGGTPFTVSGAPIAADAALLEAGFDVLVAPNTTLGLYYNGQLATSASDNMVKGAFSMKF